jgi:DNA-binding MarR family transcriptional regulator
MQSLRGAVIAWDSNISRVEGQPGATRADVLDALTRWTVQVTQFNGMVADHMRVTQSDLQCLFALVHHGPSTAAQLARHVNLTTGSASRMIDRLAAAGYVTRTPDPHDRRKVLVAAEPTALERVAEHYRPLNARLDGDLADLDADALAVLLRFAQAAERSTEAEMVTQRGWQM